MLNLQVLSPRVQERSSGYYYRQRVPAALQSTLGKREIVMSLGTRETRRAHAMASEISEEIARFFTEVKAELGQLEHSRAKQIAENWKRRALNVDFERRLAGKPLAVEPEAESRQLRQDLGALAFGRQWDWVSTVAARQQLDAQPDSRGWKRLAYYLLKARLDKRKERLASRLKEFFGIGGSHSGTALPTEDGKRFSTPFRRDIRRIVLQINRQMA